MRETGAQDRKLFLAFLQPLQLLLAPLSFRVAYGQACRAPGAAPVQPPTLRNLLCTPVVIHRDTLCPGEAHPELGCSGHSGNRQAVRPSPPPPAFLWSLCVRHLEAARASVAACPLEGLVGGGERQVGPFLPLPITACPWPGWGVGSLTSGVGGA